MHFNAATRECNCWNRRPYLASTPWLGAMAAATTRTAWRNQHDDQSRQAGVSAGAGAATGGVTGLLGGLLNDITGLLGGLGLGGIL
jgi:hypothetical protein